MQPVIAAINGPAIGAGLCLALACDLRVAAASARMGVTFVGLGLHPGMGATHTLPQIVGPQQAAKLILTGQLVTGKEAERIGMVVEAVEASEDEGAKTVSRAMELASMMTAQSPIAVRTAVRSLRLKFDEGFERALWREADAQAQSYASEDLANGVNAIASKTKASFEQWEHFEESSLWEGGLSARR
jgi:enoyl-CoA hydratase